MKTTNQDIPLADITLDARLQPRAARNRPPHRPDVTKKPSGKRRQSRESLIAYGLRRNNADKRRAATMLLTDAECAMWSNRRIASHCGISPGLVADVRKTLAIVAAPSCAIRKGVGHV